MQVNSVVPQSNQSTVRVAYPESQTAGNTNVLAIGWNDSSSNITSVTDSGGNTYRATGPTARGNRLSQAIFYASNIKAAAGATNTVTVTFNEAVAYADVRILEYGGLDRSNPFDASTSGAGNGSMAASGMAATSTDNQLVVGAGMTTWAYWQAGASFNSRVVTSPDTDIAEDRIVTSRGSYAATAPSTGDWLMTVATFKAAAN